MTNASVVALLPMKAHSERVPHKNFRVFAGKPLFRWMLDKLAGMDNVDLVVINTDARGILEDFGVRSGGKILVRDRKPEICGDLVSMNRVLEDDIASVSAATYLMTHTTNPLLSQPTIERAFDVFHSAHERQECDSLFSVNRYQSRFYRKGCEPVNHDPASLIRTQDLDPLFEENSNLYIFTTASFKKTGARIGKRPLMFETPREESIDIDDSETWSIAELLAGMPRVQNSGTSEIAGAPAPR